MTQPATTGAMSAPVVVVSKRDLPLACPRSSGEPATEHPRVFIALKKPGDEMSCPYCRTRYRLEG